MPRVESGVAVESVAETTLQRWRLSWEEYLALPDDLRAEWVDGEVVVSPVPSVRHGVVVARLTSVLTSALPGLDVVGEAGVWLPGNRLRGPDLMVVASLPTTTWLEQPPVLVVEVLSHSTRAEDTLRKPLEYAAAGVEHLWLVDPARRIVDAYVNVEGRWESAHHLDAGTPSADVGLGDHGDVRLDIATLLPT